MIDVENALGCNDRTLFVNEIAHGGEFVARNSGLSPIEPSQHILLEPILK